MHGIRHQGLVYKEVVEAHQIIKNLTTGDLGIPFVVIRAGVSGLKKCRLVHLPDLSEGGRDKGHYDLVCVERLWMIGLMAVMLMSCSSVVKMVLVLCRVGPVLRKGYGIY